MIFGSLILSWFLLLPIEIVDFSKSVISVLFFVSNFFFYSSQTEYGAVDALNIPLLHTWSLSIEEQFYLFFPIIISIVYKFKREKITAFLLFLSVLSLCVAEIMSRGGDSILNFFSTLSRIWELLLGSIFAVFVIEGKLKFKNRYENFLCYAGFLAIVIPILIFNDSTRNPSLLTLIPVMGTCLVIITTDKNKNFLNIVLSSKILVGIGLISYSLYLWHFPIFAFSRITEFTQGEILRKILLILVIFLLSVFSYWFIEKPFRKHKIKFKKVNFLIIPSIFVLLFSSLLINHKDGVSKRFAPIISNSLEMYVKSPMGTLFKDNCEKNFCFFFKENKKKIFLVGDSHARSLLVNLKKKLENYNFQFISAIRGGCFFFPEFKLDENCDDIYFQKITNLINNNPNSTVIFSGHLPLFLYNLKVINNGKKIINVVNNNRVIEATGSYSDIRISFIENVKKIAKSNNVILVYPVPEVGFHPLRRLANKNIYEDRSFFSSLDLKELSTKFDNYIERTVESFEMLDSIESSNVSRVYPHEIFCNSFVSGRCVVHDGSFFYYDDDNHLSQYGSELVNSVILDKIILNK
jgi:peptidoglycan/LPS O-acetylase OafA/YrhL